MTNMKGRSKATIVGAFVLIAVVIAAASLIVLGGGQMFAETVPFVMFFDGSVTGLDEGAPVTFRGVKIGTVSDIRVSVGEGERPRIPVYVRLERDTLAHGKTLVTRAQIEEYMLGLIAEGLRAELRLESFVTGQLMVQLDFFPEVPPLLVGGDLSLVEIPTRQTGLEKFARSVEQLPLDQIIDRVTNALEGIDRLVNAPETRDSLTNLAGALKDMRAILRDMREQVGPVRTELEEAAKSLRQVFETLNERLGPLTNKLEATADDTQALVRNVNSSVDRLTPKLEQSADAATSMFKTGEKTMALEAGPAAELVDNLNRTAESADQVLREATETLASLEDGLGARSPVQSELSSTLRELSEAARSLRVLADYLQRHPDALIRGRRQTSNPEP